MIINNKHVDFKNRVILLINKNIVQLRHYWKISFQSQYWNFYFFFVFSLSCVIYISPSRPSIIAQYSLWRYPWKFSLSLNASSLQSRERISSYFTWMFPWFLWWTEVSVSITFEPFIQCGASLFSNLRKAYSKYKHWCTDSLPEAKKQELSNHFN